MNANLSMQQLTRHARFGMCMPRLTSTSSLGSTELMSVANNCCKTWRQIGRAGGLVLAKGVRVWLKLQGDLAPWPLKLSDRVCQNVLSAAVLRCSKQVQRQAYVPKIARSANI